MSFAWDFGDGIRVTGDRNVGHIYRNNGSYVATLIVSDLDGAGDTASTTVTIANVDPQITLLRFPDTVVAGTPVEIEIQYADPGLDDTVYAMIWIFRRGGNGGGTGIDGPGVVVRTFFDPDEYTISVSAWDNDGAITSRAADHPLVVIVPRSAPIVAARWRSSKSARGS